MLPAVISSPASSNPSCTRDLDTNNSNEIAKKKRNLPGNPDPHAEVIALSPTTLLATNRFVCEICNKGFQRDQNLQLHRRGHNLPWKLKHTNSKETDAYKIKRVYVCPESSCVHHHPSRALGDLTGIKKHFGRKHGEKKWKCDKCSKAYAVRSDLKAHSTLCGTRDYRCECGTTFSRRDSFISHRTFCEALAKQSGRLIAPTNSIQLPLNSITYNNITYKTINHKSPFSSYPQHISLSPSSYHPYDDFSAQNPNPNPQLKNEVHIKQEALHLPLSSPHDFYQGRSLMRVKQPRGASTPLPISAMDAKTSHHEHVDDGFTRDFLGLVARDQGGNSGGDEEKVRPEFPRYGRDNNDHYI